MRLFCLGCCVLGALGCSLDRVGLGVTGNPDAAVGVDGGGPGTDAGPLPDGARPDAGVAEDAATGPDSGADAEPPAPSPSACDDVLSGVLFCDGFEGGITDAWDAALVSGTGSIGRTTSRVYRGDGALHARVRAAASRAYVEMAGLGSRSSGDLYFRAYFYLARTEDVTNVTLAILKEPVDTMHVGLLLWLETAPAVWVQETGDFFAAPTGRAPRDTWFCLQSHIVISDSAGSITVSIDGVEAATRTGIDTRVPGGYDELELGVAWMGSGQGPMELFVDEVVVDTSPIPCDP